MTFIPFGQKNFSYAVGDSDDVGTNTWDCPTCACSMPPTTGSKKGDTFTCQNCGCTVEVVYPPARIERTTIRIVDPGEEPGLHLVLNFDGMKLRLGRIL
jgi:hypothetical protein